MAMVEQMPTTTTHGRKAWSSLTTVGSSTTNRILLKVGCTPITNVISNICCTVSIKSYWALMHQANPNIHHILRWFALAATCEWNCVPLLRLSYQNANKNIHTHLFFHFLHLWLIPLVTSTMIWWILYHCCPLLTLHSTKSVSPPPCPSSQDQKQRLWTHFVVIIDAYPVHP